jgi:DNA anti-recombination protein RmuC
MTSAEIAGLRDFISVELGKVHDRVDQVYALQLDFQAHVATHFGEVYTRLDRMDTRLSRVEIQQEEMRGDFRALGEGLQSANQRIDELRSDMDRGFEQVRAEMDLGSKKLRSDMDQGFLELRSDMDRGFEQIRSDMDQGFLELREEMREGFRVTRRLPTSPPAPPAR